MKPQPTFSVNVRLWLHSDSYTWVPFSWNQTILRVKVWGPSGTLAMKQGSPELISDYGAQRAHQIRPRCIGTINAQTQILINQSINQSMRVLFNQRHQTHTAKSQGSMQMHLPSHGMQRVPNYGGPRVGNVVQQNDAVIEFTLIFVLDLGMKKNSMALVRERTIPTERPPPVGEVSANFCG